MHKVILQRARSMRVGPTSAEDVLWERLRDRRLKGWKFRRQFAFESFILDFYCAEAKLVVEVDGPIHLEKKNYDEDRTIWLEVSGFKVVRFTNARVIDRIEEVLSEIDHHCRARISPRPGTPGRGAGGEGHGVRDARVTPGNTIPARHHREAFCCVRYNTQPC